MEINLKYIKYRYYSHRSQVTEQFIFYIYHDHLFVTNTIPTLYI